MKRKGLRASRKAFSLVELMVVVAVISILALGLYIYYGGSTDKARVAKTVEFANNLKRAMSAYYADTGYYPSKTQQLWTNAVGAPGWNGPYVEPPNNNVSLNYWPHTPWSGTGWIACTWGSNVQLVINGASKDFCYKLDRAVDDGNLSAGNVRWDSSVNRCRYFLIRGTNVRCK
ncbi:hypothetical protein Theam_1801 (plasmid) [Thermovibrio ammonificans HB-1]|uniref:Uncharacterized protein n=1 Tax=Thermovibrio ammonificans (strain DSM 15698 / JCM 12110 / HB-1) TaxID=648996 RepID=E8T6T4_THEA1|nr:type II secretion system protein [Thermovibrio ammonificans]ADU97757.1 hypothetical protein Theam_1801 [Thermovibrio ammonificans HB-1]